MNTPNLTDALQYILRLIGKVVSVSLETVDTVEALPGLGLMKRREVDRRVYILYGLAEDEIRAGEIHSPNDEKVGLIGRGL